MSIRKRTKMLPVTIITVLLDLDDRLKILERRAGIKLEPFSVRSRRHRKPRKI